MNTSRSEAIELASAIISGVSGSENADILICPPAIHLADISKIAGANSGVKLGAQDLHWADKGAFTGELSGPMLADYQVDYVLVGHSERRQFFADDNARVADKYATALQFGLTPILCIGETLAQREEGITFDVLKSQLSAVLDKVGVSALAGGLIAYEPVWAIGTGKTATPEQAQMVHQQIRCWLSGQNAEVASELRILYGGSMNASNAAELLAQSDIDGGLIGGASLKAEDFLKIYSAAR